MNRPACPTCGIIDERPPDPLGVHRCSACATEFRPPLRMPVRRAAVATTTNIKNEVKQWGAALVIVAGTVGLSIAFGDYQGTTPGPPPPIIDPFQALEFNPVRFDARQYIGEPPLAPIPLQHEFHISQLVNGELFVTGLIFAAEPVEELRVQVSCWGPGGRPLGSHDAVVACERMQAEERCAWAIELEFAEVPAEFELEASGRPVRGLSPQILELRSDRPGELDFDANQRTVKFATRERTLRQAWASVTAYSAQGRVLDVAKTRYGGDHQPGQQQLTLQVPALDDQAGWYEVRVGGELSQW